MSHQPSGAKSRSEHAARQGKKNDKQENLRRFSGAFMLKKGDRDRKRREERVAPGKQELA